MKTRYLYLTFNKPKNKPICLITFETVINLINLVIHFGDNFHKNPRYSCKRSELSTMCSIIFVKWFHSYLRYRICKIGISFEIYLVLCEDASEYLLLYLHSTVYCKLKTKIKDFSFGFEYLWTSSSCPDLYLKYTIYLILGCCSCVKIFTISGNKKSLLLHLLHDVETSFIVRGQPDRCAILFQAKFNASIAKLLR